MNSAISHNLFPLILKASNLIHSWDYAKPWMGHYRQFLVHNSCSLRNYSIPLPFTESLLLLLCDFVLSLREMSPLGSIIAFCFDICLICCNVVTRGWKASMTWNWCHIAIMGPRTLCCSWGLGLSFFSSSCDPCFLVIKRFILQQADFSHVYCIISLENCPLVT